MPSTTTAGATAATAAAASSGAALAKKPGLQLESSGSHAKDGEETLVEAAATPENSAAPPAARKRQRGEATGPAPKKDRVWQPATGAGGSSFSASVGWQRPSSEMLESPIDSPRSAEREPDDEYSDWHAAGE